MYVLAKVSPGACGHKRGVDEPNIQKNGRQIQTYKAEHLIAKSATVATPSILLLVPRWSSTHMLAF